MARFSVKGATELVKVTVEMLAGIHPIVSLDDIDKYRGACQDILLLKYDDTKSLRNFFGGLNVLLLNLYNDIPVEPRSEGVVKLNEEKFRVLAQPVMDIVSVPHHMVAFQVGSDLLSVEEWFNNESGL